MYSGTTSSCVQYFFHTLVNELTTLFLSCTRIVQSKCQALEAKLAASRTGPGHMLWMLTPNEPSLWHCPESPFSLSKWYVRVRFPTSAHTRVKSPSAVQVGHSAAGRLAPAQQQDRGSNRRWWCISAVLTMSRLSHAQGAALVAVGGCVPERKWQAAQTTMQKALCVHPYLLSMLLGYFYSLKYTAKCALRQLRCQ